MKKWCYDFKIGQNSQNEMAKKRTTKPKKKYSNNNVNYLVRLSKCN